LATPHQTVHPPRRADHSGGRIAYQPRGPAMERSDTSPLPCPARPSSFVLRPRSCVLC